MRKFLKFGFIFLMCPIAFWCFWQNESFLHYLIYPCIVLFVLPSIKLVWGDALEARRGSAKRVSKEGSLASKYYNFGKMRFSSIILLLVSLYETFHT